MVTSGVALVDGIVSENSELLLPVLLLVCVLPVLLLLSEATRVLCGDVLSSSCGLSCDCSSLSASELPSVLSVALVSASCCCELGWLDGSDALSPIRGD